MKKTEIRETVEKHLAEVGFAPAGWVWNGAVLLVAAGNIMCHIKLKAGMSKRALSFELGRLARYGF